MQVRSVVVWAVAALVAGTMIEGQQTGSDRLTADVFEGLALRSIGPAVVTGRVADIDVDPPSVAFDLIGVAVRRSLAARTRIVDPTEILADRDARQRLEDITVERTAQEAATALLGWLVDRSSSNDPHV